MKWIRLIALCVWGVSIMAQGQNGIFADVSTSMGDFSLYLDYEQAPRAVASFVGLATGEKSWADETGNVWMDRPFYDGSLIHRVVKDANTNGIAIQGGGWPIPYLGTVYQPIGVSTNFHGSQQLTTNGVGIETNILQVAWVTTNAPAVATNYVTGTNLISTNAPTITTMIIAGRVLSTNEWVSEITNTSLLQAEYINYSLTEHITTNFSQTTVIITNNGGSPVITTHEIQLEEVKSETRILRLVLTNFSNAGYYQLENVTNGLSFSNGVIAMANSGPNTDGSQFFITTTNMPVWDGGYTVFGHVTTGMNVVTSIAGVAVSGSGSRPVLDVRVSQVAIRRTGSDATNFNIASQAVPVVASGLIAATPAGSNMVLEIQQLEQSEMLFRESGDLVTWEAADWGYYTNATTNLTGLLPASSLFRKYFFHSSQIQYLEPISSEVSQRGRYFTFYWDSTPAVKYEAIFSTNWFTSGGYRATTGTNTPVTGEIFIFDTWTQDPYSARLGFIDDSGKEYSYNLGFNPGQSTNRFTGYYIYSGSKFPLSGVFTVTGP